MKFYHAGLPTGKARPIRLRTCVMTMVAVLLAGHVARAQSGADINNGIVRLGVNKDGSLIITPTVPPLASAKGTALLGIRLMSTNNDGSSPAAPLDGWGVADSVSGKFGTAVNAGPVNLAGIAQVATATTANCTCTAAGVFQVDHNFSPSPNPNAYQIIVTIKNISAALVKGRYRRTIDWDIEPTALSEYVTVKGATLSGILAFTDSGFSSQNPLTGAAGTNGDVTNKGPADLGVTIDFDLGDMAPGASITFTHYYGVAPDRPSALAAATALGVQGYTLASPSVVGPTIGTPNTFFYGFFAAFVGGGGGPPPPPPPPVDHLQDEGNYPDSNGSHGAQGSGHEGSFGFGGRSVRPVNSPATEASPTPGVRVPSLLGPYRDPEGQGQLVFNVAQRQGIVDASVNPGSLGEDSMWDYIVFAGAVLGLMILVGLANNIPVMNRFFQTRLF